MTCEGNVCGTGGWGGPKPGDPNNDSILRATPAFGGIDINFTYPTVNPYALAYTMLYRGVLPDFANAILIQDALAGSYYFDRVDPGTTYYYWIQFVSINGTIGDVIGPASAQARDSIEQTLRDLTGKIDAGVLAQALKTEIARIPEIDDKIFQEIEDRLSSNQALSNAIAQVQNVSDETLSYVQQEITQRQDADGVLAESINTLFAQMAGNAAAINEEKLVRVSKDDALSQRIDTLATSWGPDIAAAIAIEQTARTNADGALAQDITTLFTRTNDNAAAVIAEQTARTTHEGSVATTIADLYTKHGEALSAVDTERTSRTSADSALASDITTLFSRVSGADAAIQSTNQAIVDAGVATTSQINTMRTTINGDITNAINGEAGARNAAISSAVQSEANTRSAADSALSQQITTAESSMGSNLTQVQTLLQTNIDTTNGKLTSIGALYTAKVSVNGLIGGFGVYNDGSEVEAGFDVDRFWVGRTNDDKIKPFIIDSGTVYINEAVIRHLEVEKITSGSVNSEWRIRGLGGRIVMDTGAVMKVIGTGFGANKDLIEWFGPSMPIEACTKANATIYEAIDGSAYYGGALRAGTLYNAQRTTQTAANAQVPLGPFWSNGNPRVLVVSYTFNWEMLNNNAGSTGYQYQGGDTYADIQLWKGNTMVSSSRMTGSYTIDNDLSDPDSASISIGGSFTFTDTGPAGNYSYSAVIVSRSLANITHSSGANTSSNITQSLGIVSTEA